MKPLPPPSEDHNERGAGPAPTPAPGTLFQVSGITPSGVEIRRVHHRVAHHDVPMPARSWIRSRTTKASIPLPDRRPGEPVIRREQVLKIRSFSREIDGRRVATLGEEQADCFIGAMTKLRREHSGRILREYYTGQGEAIPQWVIDQAFDHPGHAFRRQKSRNGWPVLLICLCVIWVLAKMVEAAHR